MTESEPTLTWETERLIWLRFHTIECEKRRPGGIFDVRARRLSVQQSLRARFGIHTVDGAPRPWTRGPSPATAPAWWPECPERGHAVSATWATPDAGSLSQISCRGTRPSCCISSHAPSNRSSVFLVGIIRPVTNREYAAVITRPAAASWCRPRAGSSWAGTTDRTAPRHRQSR